MRIVLAKSGEAARAPDWVHSGPSGFALGTPSQTQALPLGVMAVAMLVVGFLLTSTRQGVPTAALWQSAPTPTTRPVLATRWVTGSAQPTTPLTAVQQPRSQSAPFTQRPAVGGRYPAAVGVVYASTNLPATAPGQRFGGVSGGVAGAAAVLLFAVLYFGRRGARQAQTMLPLYGATAMNSTPTPTLVPGAVARTVARIDKPPRLPVWPVVNGLVFTFMDILGLKALAAKVEDWVGGRVAPMMLDTNEADPFILLVHHRHRFDFWDPIRPIFRVLLPEGFPAHPHRGFETVTMTLKGGLNHRDSFGMKQDYSNGDVQWLTAGRGMLHEEMWSSDEQGNAELYQLWLNLPAKDKMQPPKLQVIGTSKDAIGPVPVVETPEATIRVIGGGLGEVHSPIEAHSEVTMLHIVLKPSQSWSMPCPGSQTCLLYVRKGVVDVGARGQATTVDTHHLAYLAKGSGNTVELHNTSPGDEVDVLLLAAEPLGEPVSASGTWVMNTPLELQEADRDYQLGRMGTPWDHKLSDEEWKEWLKAHPMPPTP